MKCRQVKLRRLFMETLERREMLTAITPVTNPTSYPASATVSIEETFDTNHNGHLDANDSTFICSGAMINKHYVLTAAHCLYDKADGGFAKKIVVRPGRSPGNAAPFGVVNGTRVVVPTAYTQGNHIADIGVIKVDKDIGVQTGYYGYKVASTFDLQHTFLNMRHYPGSPKSNGRLQFYSGGLASSVGPNVISYRHSVISTFGGSSGAPVYFAATKQIVGVHVRGSLGQSGANEATRLTLPFFNLIQKFRTDNQSESLDAWNGEVIGETYDLKTGRVSGPTSVAANFQSAEAAGAAGGAVGAALISGSSSGSMNSSPTTSGKPTVASTLGGTTAETITADLSGKKDQPADVKLVNQTAADALFSDDVNELFPEPALTLL